MHFLQKPQPKHEPEPRSFPRPSSIPGEIQEPSHLTLWFHFFGAGQLEPSRLPCFGKASFLSPVSNHQFCLTSNGNISKSAQVYQCMSPLRKICHQFELAWMLGKFLCFAHPNSWWIDRCQPSQFLSIVLHLQPNHAKPLFKNLLQEDHKISVLGAPNLIQTRCKR